MSNERTLKLRIRELTQQLELAKVNGEFLVGTTNDAMRFLPTEVQVKLVERWRKVTEGPQGDRLAHQRDLSRIASVNEARSLLRAASELITHLDPEAKSGAATELLADIGLFVGRAPPHRDVIVDENTQATLHANGQCGDACPICAGLDARADEIQRKIDAGEIKPVDDVPRPKLELVHDGGPTE